MTPFLRRSLNTKLASSYLGRRSNWQFLLQKHEILVYRSIYSYWASLVAQLVKNPFAMLETKETGVWSLGWEDPLEKEMATTLVFLPGKFHEQRSMANYSLWGCKRVKHDLANKQFHHLVNLLTIVSFHSWNFSCKIKFTIVFYHFSFLFLFALTIPCLVFL